MGRKCEARSPAGDRACELGKLLGRVALLGEQGLSRRWLVVNGACCFGDWQAALDELVEAGLVERRSVQRWGTDPPGRSTHVVYFAREGPE